MAEFTTLSATLPIINLSKPDLPELPITIKSTASSFATSKITLAGEDLELFKKMLIMLDDVEDVSNVYHNVENV